MNYSLSLSLSLSHKQANKKSMKKKVEAMEKQESGKVSYGKRKRTLEKKAQDLSTLCGISVCTVCFDPSGKVDTWPKDPDAVRAILGRYTAKRDAHEIWELMENHKLDNEEDEKNVNFDKEKNKKNKKKKKKKKEEEEEEEKSLTVNHKQQVQEEKEEKRHMTMLKLWETWGSRLEDKEDLSQEYLMGISKALDYKLQIVNGMIGLKQMTQSVGVNPDSLTSSSYSTSTTDTASIPISESTTKGDFQWNLQ